MTARRDWCLVTRASHAPCPSPQGLCQEAAAADRHEGDSEELCRLPQAAQLAVVEALHQGACSGPTQFSGPPTLVFAPDVGLEMDVSGCTTESLRSNLACWRCPRPVSSASDEGPPSLAPGLQPRPEHRSRDFHRHKDPSQCTSITTPLSSIATPTFFHGHTHFPHGPWQPLLTFLKFCHLNMCHFVM